MSALRIWWSRPSTRGMTNLVFLLTHFLCHDCRRSFEYPKDLEVLWRRIWLISFDQFLFRSHVIEPHGFTVGFVTLCFALLCCVLLHLASLCFAYLCLVYVADDMESETW